MVDACVGRVMDALKVKGIWDDALVILTSDHGEMLGCHHLMQKHCCYEEAAHLPLLVKPPGGASGRRRDLVSAVDFTPTVCEFAGLEPPEGVQGTSYRSAVEDQQANGRDAVFMEYNGDQGRNEIPMRSVVADVDGRTWKYIYTRNDVDELYDLDADPMEMHSLVQSEDHRSLREALREKLVDWMQETDDIITLE